MLILRLGDAIQCVIYIFANLWFSAGFSRHVLKSVGLLEECKCIPDNNRTPGMCAALAKAWELYGEQR